MAQKPDLTDVSAFLAQLDALPSGVFYGTSLMRRYVVAKSRFAGGKSIKLVAHELGGADYISLNLYRFRSGARLFPCEMSHHKVMEFVADLQVHPGHRAA